MMSNGYIMFSNNINELENLKKLSYIFDWEFKSIEEENINNSLEPSQQIQNQSVMQLQKQVEKMSKELREIK